MVERIKITQNQIVTRRADGSISFDTNNLYLKTDPAGTLKAGGYQRCPVLSGHSTLADRTEFGGFPLTSVAPGIKPQSFSGYITSSNFQIIQNLQIGPYVTYSAVSSIANITYNGGVIGTYRRLYLSSPDPEQEGVYADFWGITGISVTPSFSGGFVVFENPPNSSLYTVNDPNVLHSMQADTSYFECGGITLLYTQDPINLSIAVTP